jgi:hypothetical protein
MSLDPRLTFIKDPFIIVSGSLFILLLLFTFLFEKHTQVLKNKQEVNPTTIEHKQSIDTTEWRKLYYEHLYHSK